jgi:TolB-like protein/Tfp pilus assembly protein PilF
MSLLAELKRRNVFRVGAAYLVVGWLLIEVADTVFPRLGLPEWTVTFVIALLLLGLPVALFLAWAFELTPEGVKRTEEVEPHASVTPQTGRAIDKLILVGMVVVVAVIVADRFLFRDGGHGEPGLPAEQLAAGAVRTPVPAPTDEAGQLEASSIAVLPFADMSAAGDQEYFGDGLAEEILNLLAGVRELKVSGRTSSFSFKGKDTPIPEIGRALGVAHILEGSVRKAGERVRITAQLVKAEDGFHLWSETYDRQLADIFAIQDEIAGAIANALQLQLRLVGQVAGTGNLEAYDLYLQARTLIYQRTLRDLQEARGLVDRALTLDPDYAPALAASGELWQLLSDGVSSYGDIPVVQAHAAARRDLDRALRLDPGLADAHAALGLLSMSLGDYAAADAHLARALAINPSLTSANNWRALNYANSGRARDAVSAARQFAERDPLFVVNQANLVYYLAMTGDFAGAEELGLHLQQRHPEHIRVPAQLSFSQRFEGRLAAAKASMHQALSLDAGSLYSRLLAEQVHYDLGDCARALEYTVGWTEDVCRFVLDRDADSPARARLAVRSNNYVAVWGWLQGLSLRGRHEELLAWLDESGYGVAELRALMPQSATMGNEPTPLAVAQRATGRTAELDATLQAWGAQLAFLEANGNATGYFRYAQAAHAALSDQRERALALLAQAIDLGFRDPLLARMPAFEPWHDDPEFLAQAARMDDLINIERAKLGMAPL